NHKAFSRFCLCGHEKSGLAELIRTAWMRWRVLLVTCPNGCMHTILGGIGLRTSGLPRFTTRTAISISLGSSSWSTSATGVSGFYLRNQSYRLSRESKVFNKSEGAQDEY
ncbi:hypothetical protein, partial [Pseudomonas aeruginosa]|uniref:hypothetical protein n=1 Tax=Pseudomonas aeruginosa TaxID=287 RepID=UPI001E55F57D